MKIKIDTSAIKARIKEKELSYNDVCQLIKNKHNISMTPQNIAKLVNNNSQSYKTTALMASVLGLKIEDVYRYE